MQLLLGNLKARDHLGDVMVDASITHTHSIIYLQKESTVPSD